MSKVLRLLDFEDHLTHDHYYWLLENETSDEEFYEQCAKDLGLGEENETDNDFTADDIPF